MEVVRVIFAVIAVTCCIPVIGMLVWHFAFSFKKKSNGGIVIKK